MLCELQGIGFGTGAYVEDPVRNPALHGSEIGSYNIANVDVIADAARVALLSSGKDLDRLIGKHSIAEDGNNASFAVGILSRAVDVGVAEDGVIESMFAAGGFKIFLDGKLTAGVWAEWHGGCLNSSASAFRDFAIDCSAGTGEHQVFDTGFGAALKDIEGANDVDGSVSLGFTNTH